MSGGVFAKTSDGFLQKHREIHKTAVLIFPVETGNSGKRTVRLFRTGAENDIIGAASGTLIMPRVLLGPVDRRFADSFLADRLRSDELRVFGPGADVDSTSLQVGHSPDSSSRASPSPSPSAAAPASATWLNVEEQFPAGWHPDVLVLWLPYTSIPEWVWSAPIPIVALAPDWNLLWHQYRHQLPRCEAVLTDGPGVEAMARAGIHHAHLAHLYGLVGEWFSELWADPAPSDDSPQPVHSHHPRDLDVVFVGNMNPAIQGDRLAWLGRLARLSRRYRVQIGAGAFGADYRSLLRRAKIVFNRSIRGEANQRAFEAAAAGAVLLQERDNRELPRYLTPDVDYVPYGDDDLEERIAAILGDDARRIAIARSAQMKVKSFRFETLLTQALANLDLESLRRAVADRERRCLESGHERSRDHALSARVWQRVGHAGPDDDPELLSDLVATGRWHDAGVVSPDSRQAERCFRRAAPGNRVAAAALAETLLALGSRDQGVALLQETADRLAVDGSLTARECASIPVPYGFGPFRVGWERAGWSSKRIERATENREAPSKTSAISPGIHNIPTRAETQAKGELLAWQIQTRLAELTEDLRHHETAFRLRPQEPSTRASLGEALVRAGRPSEAIPLLRSALEKNPFLCDAARTLYRATLQSGDVIAARQLGRDRAHLHAAAPKLVPSEDWFNTTLPVGDELASIVILCCNEVEVTRGCLESLLAETRAPFELILVDNGSTDGTPDYFAQVAKRREPERIQVLRHDTNLGFAVGVNRGLAVARGDWIVLLNNDTVVPPHWLERLLSHAVAGVPTVGLVSPMTNQAPPPQRLAPGYTDLADLASFAESVWSNERGRSVTFPRLSGFCLAGHREVFEKLGPLDEQFGTGFFEDDDFCVRARRAGYELRVALDTYLHHHGNRTFKALGIDTARQLDVNFEAFRAKWGEEEAAPYRRPDRFREHAAFVPTPDDHVVPANVILVDPAPTTVDSDRIPHSVATHSPTSRARVSLTMIVKNEEDNLTVCLDGLQGLFFEMIVVDTGSTDRTRDIAKSLGATVREFPWVNDFAAARNAALSHATGDYAFWLDADDRIDAANRLRLKELFESLNGANVANIAHVVKCRCVADKPGGTATVVDHVRLFPLKPGIRWEHRVHEQILPALRQAGTEVRWSNITVDHVGYVDPALRKRKLKRDLELLKQDLVDHPGHPFTLFNLGSVHQELGDDLNALACLGKSLSGSHPHDSITRKLFALIAQCHRRLGRMEDARAAVAEGRMHFPEDAELQFLDGVFAHEAQDWPRAEAAFQGLLSGTEGIHFGSVDAGLRGVKAHHNLGMVYFDSGRFDLAEREMRSALDLDPTFTPAWVCIGELALRSGDGPAVETTARALIPLDRVAAAMLPARFLLNSKRFAEARAILDGALALDPNALGLRILLSHAWLQDGTDPAAAERALLAVIESDPQHDEARRNLSVLRQLSGR